MLSRDEIKEKLNRIVVHAGGEPVISVPEESRLQEDLGMTSIVMLYMVIAIEQEFPVSFDGAVFSDFRTLKDMIDYIETKQELSE